jgi:hypothetical protein
MKMKVLAASLLLASTFANAADYEMMAGAELSTSEVEMNSVTSDYEMGFGLRAGFTADDHRVYLSYNNHSDLDVQSLTVVLDGMTEPYHFTDNIATSFFVGGHAGMISLDTASTSVERLMYGVQGGVMLHVNDRVNLELGGRYSFADIDSFDKMQSVYAAVNVKF